MRLILALLVPALAGCAAILPGGGHVDAPAPAPAGQVVFRVEPELGGLAPAAAFRSARPLVTVYGDGTAFTAEPGRSPDTVWILRRGHVDGADLRRLTERAQRSGLFAGADFGEPRITDVGTTVATFHPAGAPARRIAVYALGIDDIDDQLAPIQRAHRAVLRSFLREISGVVRGEREWTPDRVELVGPGERCRAVTGAEAGRLYRAALTAPTPDRSSPVLRGLLPGELACSR